MRVEDGGMILRSGQSDASRSPVSRSEGPRRDASWHSSKRKRCPFHVLFDLPPYFSCDP